MSMKIPCVAKVLDNNQLVLNIGSCDDVVMGQRFLIYGLSDDEIIDPITHESLGHLELVRGTGSVIFIQEKMCIIKSDSTSTLFATVSDLLNPSPFSNPQEGDYAREIQ
ncbi:hypothetical protein D3Z53_25830 [Lachnospiraceae bacterium]|jgi:hypothetical protein|nr:hypothetical protein [uncultured Schaedlerella sp.]NBI61314.1 hypothetical protein [Lachnospiraceae bacterium]